MAEKFDHRQSNGIRPSRGSSSKYAVRSIVRRGRSEQFELSGSIEDPENDQVGKAVNIREAGFELGKNFQRPFGLVFCAETLGDLCRFLVWTTDVTDGLRCKHR